MATPTPTSQQMSISMEENGLLPDSKPKVSVPLAGAEVRASMVIYNLPLYAFLFFFFPPFFSSFASSSSSCPSSPSSSLFCFLLEEDSFVEESAAILLFISFTCIIMSSVVCLLHSKDWTLEDSTVSCMYFISAVVLLPIFLHQMMIDHHHLHYVFLCSCCISRLNPRGFNCQLYFISTVVLLPSFLFSRWLIIISIISIISCSLHFFISIISIGSSVVLCIQRFDPEEFNCSRGRGYKFKFLILRVQGLGILGVEKKIVLEGYSKSFCRVWRCIWLWSSNVCVLFPWASFYV